jgi:porphobilinogen deaminase
MIIGTQGSKLAILQTDKICKRLKEAYKKLLRRRMHPALKLYVIVLNGRFHI